MLSPKTIVAKPPSHLSCHAPLHGHRGGKQRAESTIPLQPFGRDHEPDCGQRQPCPETLVRHVRVLGPNRGKNPDAPTGTVKGHGCSTGSVFGTTTASISSTSSD